MTKGAPNATAENHLKLPMTIVSRPNRQRQPTPDLQAIQIDLWGVRSLRWNDSEKDASEEKEESKEVGAYSHAATNKLSTCTVLTPGYEMARIRSEFVQASTAEQLRKGNAFESRAEQLFGTGIRLVDPSTPKKEKGEVHTTIVEVWMWLKKSLAPKR